MSFDGHAFRLPDRGSGWMLKPGPMRGDETRIDPRPGMAPLYRKPAMPL